MGEIISEAYFYGDKEKFQNVMSFIDKNNIYYSYNKIMTSKMEIDGISSFDDGFNNYKIIAKAFPEVKLIGYCFDCNSGGFCFFYSKSGSKLLNIVDPYVYEDDDDPYYDEDDDEYENDNEDNEPTWYEKIIDELIIDAVEYEDDDDPYYDEDDDEYENDNKDNEPTWYEEIIDAVEFDALKDLYDLCSFDCGYVFRDIPGFEVNDDDE